MLRQKHLYLILVLPLALSNSICPQSDTQKFFWIDFGAEADHVS